MSDLNLQVDTAQLNAFAATLSPQAQTLFNALNVDRQIIVYNLNTTRANTYLTTFTAEQRVAVDDYHRFAATWQESWLNLGENKLKYIDYGTTYLPVSPIKGLLVDTTTKLVGTPNTYKQMGIDARDQFFFEVAQGHNVETAQIRANAKAAGEQIGWGFIKDVVGTLGNVLGGIQDNLNNAGHLANNIAYYLGTGVGKSKLEQGLKYLGRQTVINAPGNTITVIAKADVNALDDRLDIYVRKQGATARTGGIISVQKKATPGNGLVATPAQIAAETDAWDGAFVDITVIDANTGQATTQIFVAGTIAQLKAHFAKDGLVFADGAVEITRPDGSKYVVFNEDHPVTRPDNTQTTFADNGRFVVERLGAVADFMAKYTKEVANYFDGDAFQSDLQNALALIAVRLAQGEDLNIIIAQTTATIFGNAGVTPFFNTLTDGTALHGTAYQQYVSQTLTGLVMAAVLNGDQRFTQAAMNVTVQQAINAGIAETGLPFLVRTLPADPLTGRITNILEPAGAGVAAAALVLIAGVINGQVLNGDTIKNAALAGATAYATATVTTALVGTAATGTTAATAGLLTQGGALAGPVGVVVGALIGFGVQGLFNNKTQYIHGETVSHVTQVQADGSLLLIGVREAGSLLRTTGTTNDDYVGNDSADNMSGHDVIVGQAGMNEIYARGGHDFMEGRAAADYIDAGNGDDQAEAGDGDDFVNGGNGNDRIYGGNGNDILLGDNTNESGNDVVLGGAGNVVWLHRRGMLLAA